MLTNLPLKFKITLNSDQKKLGFCFGNNVYVRCMKHASLMFVQILCVRYMTIDKKLHCVYYKILHFVSFCFVNEVTESLNILLDQYISNNTLKKL